MEQDNASNYARKVTMKTIQLTAVIHVSVNAQAVLEHKISAGHALMVISYRNLLQHALNNAKTDSMKTKMWQCADLVMKTAQNALAQQLMNAKNVHKAFSY